MSTGLDGIPMPSFADSMTDEERWAISYHVLSLSAFNDPLTGEKLGLDPATWALLNDPDPQAFKTSGSDPLVEPARARRPKALARFFRGVSGEGR